MEPLIHVTNLKHVYPDKTAVHLGGLDFAVEAGQRVVIIGPNGAGKTTLLAHLLGLLAPTEGTVTVLGCRPHESFRKIRGKVGVVFQQVDEQIIGPRVYDDIAFSLRNDGLPEDQVLQKVKDVAASLQISHLLEKIPHYLSGGEKKKVALAGALVTLPQILILDEPFLSLDPESRREMIRLLNHLSREHEVSLVITTHDMEVVGDLADVVYVFHQGSIIARGTPREIFGQVNMLKEANLEPPVLAELFHRLHQKGMKVPVPQSMAEAEAWLIKALQNKENPEDIG
ncbi:energy-coupling factor ABC transporter ATP-binding protein [Anoxynatronum buryatiense]|uniref:Cobalt/nickel transport system ATP-binding protein n=1 Tax=Anoxynatronum buryatiense TaxID=489973 RepID=A0AA46AHJ7_9CLOT|nr:ATP-binding cassette domain-containing protein [Anoxynatronum buryatiense]SMP40298.1 cobalt/nickel transport system ATP-binding protein [Anoxynatronum buryatiense]